MLTGVCLCQDPMNDVASFYARQVREFAAGHWEAAFFHLIPPLVVVLGGIVAKAGIAPFAALKIVSGLFFVAGLWPLARVLRRLAPPTLAGWGCLLYAVSPRLVRYSAAGLLDSAKLFLLLWLADQLLVYAEEQRTRPAVWLGLAAAGLALARGEGVLFLPLILAGMLLLPWLTARADRAARPTRRMIIRSLGHGALVVGITGLLCLPQILYVKSVTGYPALDSRQTKRVARLLDAWFPNQATPLAATIALADAEVLGRPRTDGRPDDVVTPWRNVREAAKGLDPLFLGLAAIGLALKSSRRRWCAGDGLCAVIILYNAALFASSHFIVSRYTVATAPFLLAWSVQGVAWLKTGLLDRLHRHLFPLAAASLILGFAADRARDQVERDNPPRQFARWLAQHRHEFLKAAPVVLVSDRRAKEYHDGRQPVIAATTPQYSFWAEADWVNILHRRWFTPEEVRALLCPRQADLLVVDRDLRATCPGLDPDREPWLERVPDTPVDAPWTVYRVRCGQEPPP
jgi:hypothetical protein